MNPARVLPESRVAALCVILFGLLLWGVAIGIPEYIHGTLDLGPLSSCLASALILGGGVIWTNHRRKLSRALLLIAFPLLIGLSLVLGIDERAAGMPASWGSVSIAVAFVVYICAAAWRSSQASKYVETDTRELERFELGSKPPADFTRQRVFITVGVTVAWLIAVPVTLFSPEGSLLDAWGPLALEAEVFTRTVAILLAGVILLVFVGPSTRRRPPTQHRLRTRIIRSGFFALAAISALITLWLR